MAGDAVDLNRSAGDAVDGRDNAERKTLFFQHWALLDVNFDIADGLFRRACLRGQARQIAAENGESLAPRNVALIEFIERLFIEGAGKRARPAERAGKARAFFVPERDHFDREGKAFAGFERGFHHLDGGDDPERPIEAAGVSHAVDMRAEHQRAGAAVAGFIAADHARQRIDPDRHPRIAHPIGDEVGGPAMGGPR